jgi:hypothetical protein
MIFTSILKFEAKFLRRFCAGILLISLFANVFAQETEQAVSPKLKVESQLSTLPQRKHPPFSRNNLLYLYLISLPTW